LAFLKREIMKKPILISVFLLVVLCAFAGNQHPRYGIASYYGEKANRHRTACGEKYCQDSFTAAYKIHPFGTYLKVTNVKNHKMAIVRINDRGPHRKKRLIDLSYAAARKIDIVHSGLAKVKVELASEDEIKNRDKLNAHSSVTDSSDIETTPKSQEENQVPDKIFMIQAGIFSRENNASNLKTYLNRKNVPDVIMTKLNFKGKECYKITIGPLDTNEKETALRSLKARHIRGLVSRIKTKSKANKKHHHKKR